ncbi:MAG: hypothetical protein D6698_04120 [Gammaproteobacteria bacterium]|nr:MAG: hypothetical protein D6698_04120 [Gammaproteobacteria bacterium]
MVPWSVYPKTRLERLRGAPNVKLNEAVYVARDEGHNAKRFSFNLERKVWVLPFRRQPIGYAVDR